MPADMPERVIRFRRSDNDHELAAELARIRPACVIAAEQIQIAWKCHQEDDWEGFYAAMMLVIAAGNRMFPTPGPDLTKPDLQKPGTARLWVRHTGKPSDSHTGQPESNPHTAHAGGASNAVATY